MNAVLVDAGPLVAALDRSDARHSACLKALASIREPLLSVWPAVTEAAYLLGEISPRAQSDLLEMVESEVVGLVPLGAEDLPRIRELMAKYGDLPMDLADAALVRAAEREKIATILTTDARDFRIYRPAHVPTFRILPR